MTEDAAFERRSPPVRDAKGHAFPHTGPNPRGGRALPPKGRSPGSLSLLRPPSQDDERPSGHGRRCRAYSGGSAPVSHRTSRAPFEVPLSVFITIRKNTRLSNEECRRIAAGASVPRRVSVVSTDRIPRATPPCPQRNQRYAETRRFGEGPLERILHSEGWAESATQSQALGGRVFRPLPGAPDPRAGRCRPPPP